MNKKAAELLVEVGKLVKEIEILRQENAFLRSVVQPADSAALGKIKEIMQNKEPDTTKAVAIRELLFPSALPSGANNSASAEICSNDICEYCANNPMHYRAQGNCNQRCKDYSDFEGRRLRT